ncbi:MAG: ATP-binding protein [Alkalispirochaeta sp.]
MIGPRGFRITLTWKLFLSHFIVVMAAGVVLGAVAYLRIPTALQHHVARMQAIVGADQGLADDLRRSFIAAQGQILTVAGIAALLATVIVGTFVAWRVVGPIRKLTAASRQIAGGEYRELVSVTGNDELAELARSFNRMAAALDKTEQRRVELIGNLAHELKTPLTTIRSVMEGLIDGVLPAETETFLDVQRETLRLQRLTEELQELSAAEAGELPLRLEKMNPGLLVRRAVDRLEPQFHDKAVQLHVDLDDSLPSVSVDGERMLQVLINLLGNAVQYTESGGSVTVGCHPDGNGNVEFFVADSGIGLTSQEITRVFERFYRVEKSRARSRGGSGIGLTIAAHIVRAHGGTIHAESEGPGMGSRFFFILPTVINP